MRPAFQGVPVADTERMLAGNAAKLYGFDLDRLCTVADQIGHLSYFDAAAVLACEDPQRFRSGAAELGAATHIDALTLGRGMAPEERLATWRANRDRLFTVSSSLESFRRETSNTAAHVFRRCQFLGKLDGGARESNALIHG